MDDWTSVRDPITGLDTLVAPGIPPEFEVKLNQYLADIAHFNGRFK